MILVYSFINLWCTWVLITCEVLLQAVWSKVPNLREFTFWWGEDKNKSNKISSRDTCYEGQRSKERGLQMLSIYTVLIFYGTVKESLHKGGIWAGIWGKLGFTESCWSIIFKNSKSDCHINRNWTDVKDWFYSKINKGINMSRCFQRTWYL